MPVSGPARSASREFGEAGAVLAERFETDLQVSGGHRQLVKPGSGECRRLAVSNSDLLPTDAADFRPDLECLAPGSSMLRGSNVIAAEVEEVIDLIVG
jgi:hypothetical protein